MKKIIQWKKVYTDKDGLTHIPIKTKGKKKFKCDDCGEKVREVFTINPCEILLRRELCRACYCKTPESLHDLLVNFDELDFKDILSENRITNLEQLARLEGVPKGESELSQDSEDFEFNKKEDDVIDKNTYSFENFGETIKEFEEETGKSIFKKELRESLRSDDVVFVVITTVCDKCGESLDVKIESGFAKIPYEASWSCSECGNFIKTKWDGKELKYL